MSAFTRSDTSVVGRWWWTVDRWSLAAIACLVGFGTLLALAASPAVAQRLGLDPFYFARRQFAVIPVAAVIVFAVSLMSPRTVRRLAVVGLVVSVALLVLTLIVGMEIKGARRWIDLGGFSLQPSEFVKPTFAVVCAWLLASGRTQEGFPGSLIALGLYLVVVALLIKQPDVGMTVVVTVVWFAQWFLAGLHMFWVALLLGGGIVGMVAAYLFLPHVTSRVDRFLDPSQGDTYQVTTSLEAFMNGGLFGRGPGEGRVKSLLPDAHADFVFAVAGEELGMLACLLILALFAFIVLRGLARVWHDNNLFVMLATAGLLVQFGLQVLINTGSSLSLIPAKGMTLPFISYGGSSLLAIALAMGMVLALTRRRYGQELA
ncbi:MAG: putative lipid II flippase FtsW [Alphaproteobacteria bacterium]|nr:putative lipid II flippase FtsW [Alphaproteobacteria bacterium]